MGDIVFQGTVMRSNPTMFNPPKKFKPRPNRLLLFPSDCFHSVEPNQSDKERISLAFNYTR
jgi:Rps23 Pro-64 3,4-dihydroxylase Tpa1-like proline 4-hydroxylase